MKQLISLFLVTLASFGFTGCGDSRADASVLPEPQPAATYKAGHGLQLTRVARDYIGLQTGAVSAHRFTGDREAPAVPAEAVVHTVRGDFVYVVNGEWFLRTPVTVGAADATHVEISDGLYEGDTVVVRGVRSLSMAEIQALNGGVGCADGH